MTEKDNIKELFAKGLQQHQVSVNGALWSAVSAAATKGAAKTGLSLFTKIALGVLTSGLVGGLIYYMRPEPKSVVQTQASTHKNNQKTTKKLMIDEPAKNSQDLLKKSPEGQTNQNSIELEDNAFQTSFVVDNNGGQDPTSQTIIEQSPLLQQVPLKLKDTNNLPNQSTIAGPINSVLPLSNAPLPSASIPQSVVETNVHLPNIFTPNNDNQNDYFEIQWDNTTVEDFQIVVLNSRNMVVYSNNDPNFKWDGYDVGGEKLEKGTYIYFITAQIDGQQWQQSSSLQIHY